MKLSLAIIAKDQVSECAAFINRYGYVFDEIIIVGDDKHEEFGALTGTYHTDDRDCVVRYFQYKWINDFSDKRNYAASKVTNEYYVRIDTDDEILGVDHLRGVTEKASLNKIDVVYCKYIYSCDKDGNTNAEHWRETIIRKRSGMYWKKRVHENIFFEEASTARTVKESSVAIKHNIDEDHVNKSNERNLKILIDEFNEDKENCDPRTIGYIGRSFLGMGMWKEAVSFLCKLVEKSGWEEDKYFAYCQMSEAYLRMERYDDAIASAYEAISINCEYPDAYFKLGQLYLEKQEFKTALHWYNVGINKPKPNTMIVIDPSFYGWITQLNMALCYLGLGDTDNAMQFYAMARQSSQNPSVISMEETFVKAARNNKAFQLINSLLKLYDSIDNKSATKLIESMPKELLVDERASVLRKKYLAPVHHPDRSVAFFCGGAYEDWAAPSIQMGIGGSEEAVIHSAKELVKLGYYVTVYNQCGDLAGNWDGVEYINWYEFNPADTFDTLILWRGVPFDVKAKRRILWLHDVPFDTITLQNKDWFDKVFVLSEFHKSLLPPCVDKDKIVVTRNGINLDDVSKVVRQPKRCIYTSSYDRGLEDLLDIWDDVVKEVPEAELHVFYGWETFDKMVKMGMRDPKFKERMVEKLNKKNVFHHGRVGQEQLAEEFAKSDYFTYPCKFEEISCISAMKAQAYGAIPITTGYAALAETCKHGILAKPNDYKDALIKALKEDNSTMREVMLKDKNLFTWEKVVDEWQSIFQS